MTSHGLNSAQSVIVLFKTCQYAMMMLTITFCRCAYCNSVTCCTLSFLSERRNIYRVLCTRFQYFFPDRRIPRRFRFHQLQIRSERGVIHSSSLATHLNRKGQTKHSIRSPLYTSILFHMTSIPPCWCQNTNRQPGRAKPGPFWCPKQLLWELNSFLLWALFFVAINLHSC